jgi:hypothetical protein
MDPLSLLAESWNLYRKHLWLMVGYSAWLLLPVGALFLLTFAPEHWLVVILVLLSMLIEVYLVLWMTIAVVRSTHRLLHKQEVNPTAISQESLARLLPLLQVAILQGLIILGGLLLFLIPGLIFSIWYAFTQLATILEDKKPVEALSASKMLVQGRFFPVLWRLVSGPILLALAYSMVVGFVLMLIALSTGTDMDILVGDESPDWVILVRTIGEIFLIPLLLIYSVMLYQDLKKHPVSQEVDKSCDVAKQ